MLRRLLSSSSSLLKDSLKGTTKSVAKDLKNTTSAAKEAIQDDFRAVAQAIADSSDKIDRKVRGTDKERFHAAQEAAEKTERAENDFVLSKHAENPLNKATKMAHEAKESISKGTEGITQKVIDGVKEKFHDLRDSVTPKPPPNNSKIDPMGETPNRDPVTKPQEPMSKETEELQKKGAQRKSEEDSFNLM